MYLFPRNRHYEKNTTFVLAVVRFGFLYATQLLATAQSPAIVLELGGLLIPLLLRPNHALLFKGAKVSFTACVLIAVLRPLKNKPIRG